MNNSQIQVSVLIPCYNEHRFIRKCLESIIANDYPKEKLEIIILDGLSNDGTRGCSFTKLSLSVPTLK